MCVLQVVRPQTCPEAGQGGRAGNEASEGRRSVAKAVGGGEGERERPELACIGEGVEKGQVRCRGADGRGGFGRDDNLIEQRAL